MEENCYVEPLYKNMPSTPQMQNAKQVTLFVTGIGCPNCATRVHNTLISLAVVIYDTGALSPDQLTGAVAQAGNDGRHEYRAQLLTTE